MDKLQNIVDNNEITYYENMIDWDNIDYSIIPLSIINKNIDKINWDLFTTQYKLNENLIELYKSNINWDLLDYDNLFFTENFISKFYNNIVWEKYLVHRTFNYDFLNQYNIFNNINNFKVYLIKNVVNNDILFHRLNIYILQLKINNSNITKDDINSLVDTICTYQRLNYDFINSFSEILNFKLLGMYQDLDDDIIIKYIDKFDKNILFFYQKLDINKYNNVYVKSLFFKEKFSTSILNKYLWYYKDNDEKLFDIYNNDFNIFEYDKDVNTVSIIDKDSGSSVNNEETQEETQEDIEENQEEENESYESSIENEEELNNEYYLNGYIFTINNSILIDNYIFNTKLKDNMKLHTKLNLNYHKHNINYDEEEVKVIYDNDTNNKISYNTILNNNEDVSYGNNKYYNNIELFDNVNQVFYGSYIKIRYNEFYENGNSNLFGMYVFNEKQVNEILDLFKNNINDYDMFASNIKIYNVLCNTNDVTMNDINNMNFIRTSDIDIISEISIDNETNSITENIDIIGDYLKDKYNCYSSISNNLNNSNISIKDEVQKYLDVMPDIHNKLNIDTVNNVDDNSSTTSDENNKFDKKTTTVIINDNDINNDNNNNDDIDNDKNSYSNTLWSLLGLNN